MRFSTVFALLLVLSVVALAEDASNRAFVKPPDNTPTTRINGKEYIKGEVYLAKTADPAILKSLGFRDVKFYVSAARYNRYNAMWPRAMDTDSLPPEVMGFNYEQVPPPYGNAYVFGGRRGPKIEYTSSGVVIKGSDGGKYDRFSQAFPKEPDTSVFGLSYVKGCIFLSSISDTVQLRDLGFTPFIESMMYKKDDIPIEKYLEHPGRYGSKWELPHFYIFDTCWPFDLETKTLPKTVIALISDAETTTKVGGRTMRVISRHSTQQ
jgi:hypothetical protein